MTWPRGRLYVPLALLALTGIAYATVAIYLHRPSDALTASFYRPAVVFLVSVIAGAAVMTMEGTRDRSGASERALECLPLGRREAAFLVRLPSLILGTLVALIPGLPAIAALLSAGAHFPEAIGIVVGSLGAGLVTIAVPYLGVFAITRPAKWDSVRFPIILLMWGVCVAWQLAATFNSQAKHTLGGWSWMPLVNAFGMSTGGTPNVLNVLFLAAAGAAAGIAVGIVFSLAPRASHSALVRQEWEGHSFAGRVVGELRYALRDAAVRANSVLSLLMSGLVVASVYLCPNALRAPLTPFALLVVGMFAAAAPRTIRGTYPARLPMQRLMAMSPASWAFSTTAVVALLTATLMSPAIVLIWMSAIPADTALLLLSISLVSMACAVAVGAAIPISPRNVLGQGLAGGVTLATFIAVSQILGQLFPTYVALRLLCSALVLVVAVVIALGVESFRWRPTIPTLRRE